MSELVNTEYTLHPVVSFSSNPFDWSSNNTGTEAYDPDQPHVNSAAETPPSLPQSSSIPTLQPEASQAVPVIPKDPHVGKKILAYVIIERPSQVVKVANRKNKLVKQEPFILGPACIPNNITLELLLDIIATAIRSRPQDIDISSLAWKKQKPSNGKFLPLRDQAGVNGMLSQVLAKAKPGVDCIVEIKLNPPRQTQPQLPWDNIPAEPEQSSLSSLGSATIPGSHSQKTIDEILGVVLDNSEEEGYAELRPTMAKGKFDVVVADYKEQIYEQHAMGNCPEHPKARCVVHKKSDHHFDVDEARALIWGSKLKAGEEGIDLLNPPYGCQLWTSGNALCRNKPVVQATPSAVAPVTDVTPPNQQAVTYPYPIPPNSVTTASPGYPPGYMTPYYPMMPPFFNPFMTPASATSVTGCEPSSSRGIKRHSDVRSSSPVFATSDTTLEEFCAMHKLSDRILEGLQQLDFVPGDRLSVVTEKEYMEAGFTTLSWQRVVRANKHFIASTSTSTR